MLIVPLQPVPLQTLYIALSAQSCQINVRTRLTGLFLDLYVRNSPIVEGVICENANEIVRDAYLGFQGDLAFYDTQGLSDPVYTGLGTRFLLVYFDPTDVAGLRSL